MRRPVKSRPYDSPARRHQAEATRARILTAAEASFLADGYRRTTCAAIADAAGVSEASVFAIFGSKARLLVAVVRAAVRESTSERPLRDQPQWRQLAAERDKEVAVTRFVGLVSKAHKRSWRLLSIVRTAAEEDDELASAGAQASQGRRRDCEWFVTAILGIDPAAPATKTRVDILWSLTGVELYRMLTVELDWSIRRYESWVSSMLCRELLARQT